MRAIPRCAQIWQCVGWFKVTFFSFFTTSFAGLLCKTSRSHEHVDPVLNSERDSPTLTGKAEENDKPAEKEGDGLSDEKEEEDTRSSCVSLGDSCDTGELKVHVIH